MVKCENFQLKKSIHSSKQAIVMLIRLKFIGSVFNVIDGNDYPVNELK